MLFVLEFLYYPKNPSRHHQTIGDIRNLIQLFRSSQSKSSSSSGERKQNPYSIFVSKLSKHSKGEATIDLEILVGNHYTNKDSKSCVVFKEHFTDYEGQTYDFAELFTNGQRQSGRQPAQVLWSHLGHARGR